MPAYAITKAAALVATTKWAMKLASEGFVVVTISPGVADISETSEFRLYRALYAWQLTRWTVQVPPRYERRIRKLESSTPRRDSRLCVCRLWSNQSPRS